MNLEIKTTFIVKEIPASGTQNHCLSSGKILTRLILADLRAFCCGISMEHAQFITLPSDLTPNEPFLLQVTKE